MPFARLTRFIAFYRTLARLWAQCTYSNVDCNLSEIQLCFNYSIMKWSFGRHCSYCIKSSYEIIILHIYFIPPTVNGSTRAPRSFIYGKNIMSQNKCMQQEAHKRACTKRKLTWVFLIRWTIIWRWKVVNDGWSLEYVLVFVKFIYIVRNLEST